MSDEAEIVVPDAPRARERRRPAPPEPPPGPWLDPGAWVAAVVVLALGLAGAGAGFVNGDAAAYAAQGASGDVWSRFVHVGYTGLAALLAVVAGDRLPLWLDAVSAAACAATTLGAGRMAGSLGRPPWVAATLTGAVLLPVCSFAEVDPLWVALIVWAAAVQAPAKAAVLAAVAVPISPLALLALPWLWTMRWVRASRHLTGRDFVIAARHLPNPNAGVWFGAVVVVLLLTIASNGDWWVGDRGVLTAPWPRPWRVAQAWGAESVPWWAAPLLVPGWVVGGGAGLFAVWPMFLAPPDADAWPLFTVSLSVVAAAGARFLWRWLRPAALLVVASLGFEVVAGVSRHAERVAVVRADDAAIAAVLGAMDPDDALVAPWTWGARASVRATGDPYGLPWRVPGEPVRDPAPWCGRAWERVWVLPAAALPPGWTGEAVGPAIVVPGEVARAHPLPGCPLPAESG